jgi:hypothetical protein
MATKERSKRKKSPSSSSDSGSLSSDSSGEGKDTKPSNDVVLTKYNMAAEICNVVLKVFLTHLFSII